MHKSIYECQLIQLLLFEEAAVICQEMGSFALILSEVLSNDLTGLLSGANTNLKIENKF